MVHRPGTDSSAVTTRLVRLLAGVTFVAIIAIVASERAPRTEAAFHIAVINEVMFGYGADPNIQYVEIQANAAGQSVTAHAILGYFDAAGTYGGDILEVPTSLATLPSGGRYILGTAAFGTAAGITPEFTFAPISLPATGMICYGGGNGVVPLNPPTWIRTDMNNWIDCVPYAGYVATPNKYGSCPTTPNCSTPFSPLGGAQSLTRLSTTNNPPVDWGLACPSPEVVSKAVGFNHDNHINLPPTKSFDDLTWPNSDLVGDSCGDSDDDNDGMSDVNELALPGPSCLSATAATNPLAGDSDGDRVLDGAECALGFDPASAVSKPSAAACGSNVDTDGDRLQDRTEFCGYNTNPGAVDTDGDMAAAGARDGCEAASLNNDRLVNSGDQLALVQEILAQPTPSLRLVAFDVNKDGAVNSGDQLLVAQFLAVPGQCP